MNLFQNETKVYLKSQNDSINGIEVVCYFY